MTGRIRIRMIVLSFLTLLSVAVAGPVEGIRNGSFSEINTGDGWYVTRYVPQTGTETPPRFVFRTSILSDTDWGRESYLRMKLERRGSSTPDTFPTESPRLIQSDITLPSCGQSREIVLEFDYRAKGFTGYAALEVSLVARDQMREVDEAVAVLLGNGFDDPDLGEEGRWISTQVAVRVPDDVAGEDLRFDVEFTILNHPTAPPGSVCVPDFPVVDLDQIVLRAVGEPGDAPPEIEPLCGDGFEGAVDTWTDLILLTTPDRPSERPSARSYLHRIIDPDKRIWCTKDSGLGDQCLVDLPTTLEAYAPARSGCAADLDGNDMVNGADLALLLVAWGSPGGSADLDCNGLVDGGDLSRLLVAWGFCTASHGVVSGPE